MRVERFSLFFPPLLGRGPARRDRVRRRRDPTRRLREDHRHEPGGGDPAGRRPPRLLPAAGVEADLRDRGRARGQHRARLPDPVGAALGERDQRAEGRDQPGDDAAGARRAAAGRPPRVGRRRARGLRDAARADLVPQVRRPVRRLQGGDAGHDRRVAGRTGADGRAGAGLRRRAGRHVRRLRGRHHAPGPRAGRGGRRVGHRHVELHHAHDLDDRGRLRGREAQADLRRGRLLQRDAQALRAERRAGDLPAGRSSRCRSASSTCSRSCRSTAATSSGRWPRRSAAARSPSA